jgi:uncharacterized membrane protein YbhN (UPF0104 family)
MPRLRPPDDSDKPRPASSRLKQAVRVVLPLGLLWLAWEWLLQHADPAQLWQQASRLPAWAWLAAGSALLAGHSLRAVRLQREWRHLRPVGLALCLRLVLTHNAAVILMPLRSGEAGYLWLVQRHWGVGWRESGLSLLRWRLQDAAVLALLAVLLMLPWSLAARVLLVLAALTVVAVLQQPLLAWLARRSQTAQPSHPRPAAASHLDGWLASAGNWTLKVLALGALLLALADLPAGDALRAALGGELAGVQPLQGPAGLGTYEAGVWLASGAQAAEQARVVAAALAVHAFSLAVALGAAALSQLIPAPLPANKGSIERKSIP